MACFIKVARLGGPSTIMRVSGLARTIGTDRHGGITDTAHVAGLFTIYSVRERALLRVDADAFTFNGEALRRGEARWIAPGDLLLRADLSFRLFPTGSLARIASRALRPHECERILRGSTLSLLGSIAGLSQHWPLPIESSVIIGSDPRADIQIDLPGISSHHFAIAAETDAAIIKPLDGDILVGDCACNAPMRVDRRSEITLQPLGLLLILDLSKEEDLTPERSETLAPARL